MLVGQIYAERQAKSAALRFEDVVRFSEQAAVLVMIY